MVQYDQKLILDVPILILVKRTIIVAFCIEYLCFSIVMLAQGIGFISY